jgi:hypothetical protein
MFDSPMAPENELISFINKCNTKYISFLSLLITDYDINLSSLNNLYIIHEVNEGNKIEELIYKANMANIINSFTFSDKKKILFINNIATLDKGFNTFLFNVLKEEKLKNIPIICQVYDMNNIHIILKNKCKIISIPHIVKSRPNIKTIKKYKENLYLECYNSIFKKYYNCQNYFA